MKRLLIALSIGGLAFMLNDTVVTAQGSTKAQLLITPTTCVIDVTQDGSSQNVQVSSPDCQAALPVLLTPTTKEREEGAQPPGLPPHALFSLPFAGTGPIQQELALRPNFEGTLPPTPRSSSKPAPLHEWPLLSLVVFGVVLLTVALVTDTVLFELRHTKALLQWGHRHTAKRIFKR